MLELFGFTSAWTGCVREASAYFENKHEQYNIKVKSYTVLVVDDFGVLLDGKPLFLIKREKEILSPAYFLSVSESRASWSHCWKLQIEVTINRKYVSSVAGFGF